jgi:hypothetical protein
VYKENMVIIKYKINITQEVVINKILKNLNSPFSYFQAKNVFTVPKTNTIVLNFEEKD